MNWDVFISHAAEDKESFCRPLATALRSRLVKVWFDEFTLQLGDSLRRSIDRGLSSSRFGIVVLSPAFFHKEWPQRELDGLLAREVHGQKVILPIWHNVSHDEITSFSPILADRIGINSGLGVDEVVAQVVKLILPETFEANACVHYLTQECGFELQTIRDALLTASTFEEFVSLLVHLANRKDAWVSLIATFGLPNARHDLNDTREIFGLARFPHEWF